MRGYHSGDQELGALSSTNQLQELSPTVLDAGLKDCEGEDGGLVGLARAQFQPPPDGPHCLVRALAAGVDQVADGEVSLPVLRDKVLIRGLKQLGKIEVNVFAVCCKLSFGF